MQERKDAGNECQDGERSEGCNYCSVDQFGSDSLDARIEVVYAKVIIGLGACVNIKRELRQTGQYS